jgi:hypothetical protein
VAVGCRSLLSFGRLTLQNQDAFIVGLSDSELVIKVISKKASDGSDPDKRNEFKIVAEEQPLTWQRQM